MMTRPGKPAKSAKDTKGTAAVAPRQPRVRPVPAVTRSLAILRLLGSAGTPMGVKAIADALGLVPSTALHILRVLVEEEVVKVEPGTKRYMLGNGMLALARSVLENSGFAQMVQPVLDGLSTRHGVTTMGVEITPAHNIVVLALSRSRQPFRLHVDVGARFTTMVSATGRLIAAHGGYSDAQLEKKFAAIVWDKAPAFAAWRKDVELCRRKGWAVDRDNFMVGITVVAVPMLGREGQLTHALVAAGLTDQLNAAATTSLARELQQEAETLSGLLIGQR